jgi:hemoglobin-like flavoprotein
LREITKQRQDINNPHLISRRMVYSLMFKSKPEIIEMFKRAEEMGEEKTLHLTFDNLGGKPLD